MQINTVNDVIQYYTEWLSLLPGHEFREMKGIRMSPLESDNNADTCANPNAIKSAFLGMRSRNTYFKQMSPGSLIGSGAGVGTNHTLENIGSIMVGQRSLLIDGETKGQRC